MKWCRKNLLRIRAWLRALTLASALSLFAALSSFSAFAAPVDPVDLEKKLAEKIAETPDFTWMRELAKERGLRVWFLGGAAASLADHTKHHMQQGANARTAFVLENILLPEQDIDLVVAHADGTRVSPEQMDEFRRAVEARHPRAADGRSLWDVIGLDSPHPERKKWPLPRIRTSSTSITIRYLWALSRSPSRL